MVNYTNVTMWELQPREIRVRARPNRLSAILPAPEAAVFQQVGVDASELRRYLAENNLALIVSRNVTTRDNLDHQQPLNLEVEGSSTRTVKNNGTLYSVAHLQIFQGDLIRGYGGLNNPQSGRRVLAQPLHSVGANPDNAAGPLGSTKIASDGSLAVFVPAQRALTYQLTDGQGAGVVRERLWLTFQPGEIRVCGSCHGVNSLDQAGQEPPTNQPEALRILLEHWKGIPHQSPQMSLAISPLPKGKRDTILRGGSKALVSVTGANSQAANRQVTLSLKAGRSNCDAIAQFTTDSAGSYSLRSKKLPLLSRRVLLAFSIKSAGATLSTSSIALDKARRGKVAGSRLCSIVRKAFH